MAVATIKDDLINGRIRHCYLLFGSEAYLKKLNYDRIVSAVMKNCFSPEMNTDIFNGAADIGKITDACDTLPFMSDMRLVIVKDSGLFKPGRKDESEKMAEYIPKLSDSVCLIFVENDADKRLALYKAVNKTGLCEEFSTPKEPDLIIWALKLLRSDGFSCERSVMSYFFNAVGNDMSNAKSELGKLMAYKAETKQITTGDIDIICTKTADAKIFDLTNAIGRRNSAEAVRRYHELLNAADKPPAVLYMITRQFRNIFQCQSMIKEGKTVSEIASLTGLRDFAVRECIAQSRNFTPDMLKAALKDCLELNYRLVTTAKFNDTVAVETLIIKYSS